MNDLKTKITVAKMNLWIYQSINWKSRWIVSRLTHEFGKKKTTKIKSGKAIIRLSDIVFLQRLIKKNIIKIAED